MAIFDTVSEQIKVALPDTKPLLHFAQYQKVVAWLPQRVNVALR